METRLFAVLDDTVQNGMRLKIIELEEHCIEGYFIHSLSHHNAVSSVTPLCRTQGNDPDMREFNLATKTIQIWRTGWAAYYKNNWLHILDSDSRECFPGEFSLRTTGDIHTLRDQLSRRLAILSSFEDPLPLSSREIPEDTSIKKIPQFVAEIMKRDAVAASSSCAISLELIADVPVSITSCFHIFHTESINTWLKDRGDCPVCKAPVTFTQVI
jgi:hypothetical protein